MRESARHPEQVPYGEGRGVWGGGLHGAELGQVLRNRVFEGEFTRIPQLQDGRRRHALGHGCDSEPRGRSDRLIRLDAGHPGSPHMQQSAVDHQAPDMPRDVVGYGVRLVEGVELRDQCPDSFQSRRTAPEGIGHLRLTDEHSQP